MATTTLPDTPDVVPGELTVAQLFDAVEAVRREATGNPDWALDEDQRAAIRHDRGPLRVTAGPGSGKTTVTVVTVVKWLLVDGVPPAGIVVTTFTEKAAESLAQRIERLLTALGYANAIAVDDLYVGTTHELWAEIMREVGYEGYQNVDLLDQAGQEMFVARYSDYVDVLADGGAEVFREVVANVYDDGGCSRSDAASAAASLFNRIEQYQVDIDALAASGHPPFERLADGYRDYRERLAAESRCDFARLQDRFLDFLATDAGRQFVTGDPDRGRPPIQRIAVDEYQDANPLQQAIYFRLAELMPNDLPTLVVVGDDDQALYRFRGGTVDCLIEFPDRVADALDLAPETVTTEQLRYNYRSRPEIVEWANRHVGDHPAMQVGGARAPGKAPMEAARGPVDHPSVHLLKEDTKEAAAAAFADQVERLRDEGYVQDLSQIALLAHSTREYWQQYDSQTFVGACVDALEQRGIPVHNPRDKGFTQHEEIQAMLGALIRCLDPEGRWAADNVEGRGSLSDQIDAWCRTFDRVVDREDATALADYVTAVGERVASTPPGDVLNLSPVDLCLRLRSFDPFSTWSDADAYVDRAARLGHLTQLLESFEGLATGLTDTRDLVRTTHDDYATVSTRFLGDFYWTFCRYLQTKGLDDPEDPYDAMPSGHVQVMTVHQAKGLEFPVVFVASLDRQATDNYDTDDTGTPVPTIADLLSPFTDRSPPADVPTRSERDLVRQFYVAHSRAEEDLVLLGTDYYLRPADGATVVPSLGADDGSPLDESWFDDAQRLDRDAQVAPPDTTVGPASEDDRRRPYSIVGDVLSYRRCKRQYGFLTERRFAGDGEAQLFAGLAVHQTLDWAHRYYRGDVDGAPGGVPPSTDALRDEYDSVVASLRDQRIMPIGQRAIDAVFEQVARFNDTVGPTLYPKIVDTECTLRQSTGDYVLTGVADVIAADDGATKLCDYKATDRPAPDHRYLTDYREQLLVYAGLYAAQHGDELPDAGVLYFLAEDDPEATRFEIEFDRDAIDAAMDRFEATVADLERTRETNAWSDMDEDELPDESTCDVCSFRWDCQYRDYDDR